MNELEVITDMLWLNYRRLPEEAEDGFELTSRLEVAKDRLIRSAVVLEYTLADEMLNMELSRYFFGSRRSFPQLWRTSKFRNFNYFVLEKLSLLNKLALVRETRRVPPRVVRYFQDLNDLRNALAHAFFPQNLRGARTLYKGKSVYSIEGLEVLLDDGRQAWAFFLRLEPEDVS